MAPVEIVILALVILLSLICLLYLAYFLTIKVRKTRAELEEGVFSSEIFIENRKAGRKGRIAADVIAGIFLGLSLLLLVGAIALRASGGIFTVNGQYIVHIVSDSMASNDPANVGYLTEHGVESEKLYVHDVAAFDKVDEGTLIEVMDILLYRREAGRKKILVAHRLRAVDEEGRFLMRGDANKADDPEPLLRADVIGKFARRLDFWSLVNYVAHSPSLYVVFGAILIGFVAYDATDGYLKKEIKKKAGKKDQPMT